jgi:hypothetical protein
MKLITTINRSLQADMQAELRDIERAAATGTRDAGRGLKTELRRQVTSAGLGQRLANSWRDKHYPNRKLDAASLVYTKAPQIVRAFDEGAFDALLQQIGAVLEADPTLGGVAFGLTYGRPEPAIEAVAGAPAIKTATLTVDFEFDVPVRFDIDHMAVTIETYRLHNWQQIPIVELRT